jgi:hypothetical protein
MGSYNPPNKRKILLLLLSLTTAARLYDVVLVHAADEEVTAIHFARSTRDLNISMRAYVEWLDAE